MNRKIIILSALIALYATTVPAQQVADTSYNPSLPSHEYPKGKGPVVYIDAAHNNFHTATGRYLPFARLLSADGYQVKDYSNDFSAPLPADARIIVIANALNKLNISDWYLPTPSAFTKVEIGVLQKWVRDGGSLFLIADHMPFGGALKDLSLAFGFSCTNGFALDTASRGPSFFLRKDSALMSCSVTDGRNAAEKVNKIVTFTGQAFRGPSDAIPIIKFDRRYRLLESDTAWVFDKKTKYTDIEGWWQGAYLKYGKGRLVVFGEAAMFSAQLAGPDKIKVGMNSDYAEENYKLLLNLIHWLDRKFE
jgi:hypothetical protein